MGKSTTPTYRVEFNVQAFIRNMAWSRKDGRPTDSNLAALVAGYEKSTMPGGVNEHLPSLNISGASIVRQATGETVAEYKAATFQVI